MLSNRHTDPTTVILAAHARRGLINVSGPSALGRSSCRKYKCSFVNGAPLIRTGSINRTPFARTSPMFVIIANQSIFWPNSFGLSYLSYVTPSLPLSPSPSPSLPLPLSLSLSLSPSPSLPLPLPLSLSLSLSPSPSPPPLSPLSPPSPSLPQSSPVLPREGTPSDSFASSYRKPIATLSKNCYNFSPVWLSIQTASFS